MVKIYREKNKYSSRSHKPASVGALPTLASKRSACTDRGPWKVRSSTVLEKLVLLGIKSLSKRIC